MHDKEVAHIGSSEAVNAIVTAQLRVGMAAIESKQGQGDAVVAAGTGHEVWESVLSMVKGLSEVMLSALPNFWKISKNFLDGKYKKVWSSVCDIACAHTFSSYRARARRVAVVRPNAGQWRWTS